MDRTDIVGTLSGWFEGKKQSPVNVELHPTYKCNSNCIFCEQRRGKYVFDRAMPKEKWLSIIDELHRLGTKKIQVSGGGEPMMVPDTTLEILKSAKKYGMEGKINTNGTLWAKDDLRTLVEIGLDKIIFSIDSPNIKTNDKLRGKRGMFRKAVRNIRILTKIKKSLKKEKPVIEVNSVITNLNYNQIVGLVKLSKKIGVQSMTAEPVFITIDYVHKLKLSEEQSAKFKELLKKANALADKYDIATNFENLIALGNFEKSGNMENLVFDRKSKNGNFKYPVCFEPWYFPKIGPNGEFGPCCNYPYEHSGMDIRNKSFKEIWFGKKMNDFRKYLLSRKLNNVCKNCSFTRVAINRELAAQLKEYEFKNE